MLSLLCCGSAHGARFQVDGTFSYQSYLASGEKALYLNNRFEAVVDNCNWTITAYPLSANLQSFVSQSCSFDGTNLIQGIAVNSAHVRTPDGSPLPADGIIAITNHVGVLTDKVPYFRKDYIGAVWLTYASSCYFEGITDGRMHNLFTMQESHVRESTRRDWKEKFTRTPWKRNPMFNDVLEMFTSGVGLSRRSGEWTTVTFAKPFDKGYLRMACAASGEIEKDGFAIPKKNVITLYSPKQGGTSSKDIRVAAVITVEATGLSLLGEETLTHGAGRIELPSFVKDHRLPVGDRFVSYYTSNGIPGSTSSPSFNLAVERTKRIEKALAAKPQSSKKSRGRVVFLIVSTVSLLGFIILIKSSSRKPKNQ